MSDIINILPDSVANQIAAGEVVDRPASAVKELLENALDAGASKIQLIVKDAGRTLIQVIDNGCGMSDSDARLCFERHATSKIHQADDLFAIRTMGFRGEALASIAAIAQVELRTKLHDADLGTQLLIEGCEIKGQTSISCSNGTSMAIKNLFYNVPARRNFLKKDSIELSHIEEIFKRVALVNCGIDYTFHHNGKLLYDLHAGTFAERISQLFGSSMRERLYPVDEQSDIADIHGYVSKPEYARKSRGEQYFFVNNRFIKHPALSAAVEKAYTDIIPDRYYPSYFLHITIDPSRIDINIHPTKTEVKFIDEQALFAILRAATKKAIGQFSLATELEFNPCEELNVAPAPQGYVPTQPEVKFNPDYNPFHNSGSGRSASSTFRSSGSTAAASGPSDNSRWKSFYDLPAEPAPEKPTPSTLFQESENPVLSDSIDPQLRDSVDSSLSNSVLQLQNSYIVGTLSSGLLIIDQQAAHERILFERLSEQQQSVAAQQLLFPVNCSFSPADSDIFSELLPDLRQHGFDISPLGNCTFVVSATPSDVKDGELQSIFDQMLSEYKSSMMQKFSNRTQCLCRSLAHQLAIKSGTPLQQAEMQQLIADLFCCKTPAISPSGKKTMTIINPAQCLS